MLRGPESRRKIRLRRRRAPARRRRRSPSGVDARVRGAGRERALFMMWASTSAEAQVMPWMWSCTDAGRCWTKGPETWMHWMTDRGTQARWRRDRRNSHRLWELVLVPVPARGWVSGSGSASGRARGRRGLRREAVACSTHPSAPKGAPPEPRCACRSCPACRAWCVRPAGLCCRWWPSQPAVHPEAHAVCPEQVPWRTGKSSPQTSRPRRPSQTPGTPARDAESACAPSTVAPALSDTTGRATTERDQARGP